MKKSFTKVLSVMLSLVMCMSAIAVVFTSSAVAADCTHENSEYYGYQTPTCLVPGGHMYKCEDCGEIYALEVVPTTDHTPGDAATCTTDQICTVCKTVLVPALGHKWVNKTSESDCTTGANKYDYQVCSVCGEVKKGPEYPGTGAHNLVADEANVVAPTCDKAGEMPYYCANGCGYTETVRINALGHNAVFVAEVPATCDKDGMQAHYYCAECKGYFTDAAATQATTADKLVIPAAHAAGVFLYTKTLGDCNTDRIDIYQCPVCKNEYEVNEGKQHELETESTEPTCTRYGYVYYICVLCGKLDESKTQIREPLKHLTAPGDKGTYYPATCTEGAYTQYTCLRPNCDTHNVYKVYDESKPALGHNVQIIVPAVAPTCTAPGAEAIYDCVNGCGDQVKAYGGAPIAQLSHNYVDKKVPQTCSTNGYTISECTMCHATNGAPKDIVPADGKSHVMKTEITTSPTCTKTGIETTYCELCDKADVMTVLPATGHVWDTENPVDTFAGTCIAKSYVTYECKNCPETHTVEGDYNTTAEGHEAAMGHEGTINTSKYANGVLRAPTCQVRELICFNCSACTHEYEKNFDYSVTAPHTPATHAGFAPNCVTETNGLTAGGVYCVECTEAASKAAGKQVYVWFAGKAPEIIPYEHNDVTEHDALDPTCTDDGYSAFKSCTVCDAAGNGKHSFKVLSTTVYKINKLGHTGTDKVVPAVTPNCTEGGNIAYRYCSVCDKYFAKDLDKDGNLVEIAKATVFQGAIGHNYSSVYVRKNLSRKCDQLAYVFHECANCHDKYIDEFSNVKAHTWAVDSVLAPTCTTEGHTYYVCSVCPATGTDLKEGDHKAALGHINAKGEIFWGICTDKAEDRVCVRDWDGDKTDDCPEYFDENNETHDYKHEKTVYATCDEYGYEMFLCANCGKKQITSYTPATGHAATGTLVAEECVEPTYTSTGLKVWICGHIDQNTGKICGEHITEVLPVLTGLNITIVADSAIYSGADLVNGGKVQFTVALETIDVMATSLLTTFTYDNTILTFDKAEIADVFGEGTINDAYANDKTGTLILSSYASYTEEGKVQDKKITGQSAYAVLTFNINKNAIGKNAVLTATDIEILNIKDEEPVAPITDKNAVSNEAVVIKELGNVNGDMAINTVDTMAIRKIFSNELLEAGKPVLYKATADVDMDGDVDLEDFARLNKYLIGAISYEQLVLNK